MAIREDELYEKVSDLHCVQVGRWMLTVLLMEKAFGGAELQGLLEASLLAGLGLSSSAFVPNVDRDSTTSLLVHVAVLGGLLRLLAG